MKTLMIAINKEDLKIIKFGVNKLYELLNNFLNGIPEEKYSWLYELYGFMYDKLKFEDVK